MPSVTLPRWLAGGLVYPLQERLLGRPTFAYLGELEASQYLSPEDIEDLQARKLGDLLRAAHAHCPWYRERIEAAGIPLEGPVTREELARLPLLTRAEAADHREEMVWRGVPGGIFEYNTGGSSGRPLIFWFGRRRQASDAAGRMRARRWWGVEPGDPEVYLWGAPVELGRTDRLKALRDRLVNQLVLNAFEMSAETMDAYGEAIEAFRPRCIYGYASSLALLAAHLEDRGRSLRLRRLRVVCTTGEPLFPHQRELLERVFGVPAANEFGSRDIGFTAHEAPDDGMLLMSESILLEVLAPQGRPVPPGQAGEAVITGLESWAQPFVRYRTGDILTLDPEPAPSGRGLHRIAAVAGRTTDFLMRPDGTLMHALAGIYVLRTVKGVAEFKLLQEALDRLRVQVVPGPEWSQTDAAAIRRGLGERMGEEMKIELELCEAIPPEASGKHRYVVNRVPLEEALSQALPEPGVS